MPGSIGWQGLVVILLIALIIFGPKRLPEMGRQLGKGMREFKDSVSGKDDDPLDDMAELPPAEPSIPATPPRERDPVTPSHRGDTAS